MCEAADLAEINVQTGEISKICDWIQTTTAAPQPQSSAPPALGGAVDNSHVHADTDATNLVKVKANISLLLSEKGDIVGSNFKLAYLRRFGHPFPGSEKKLGLAATLAPFNDVCTVVHQDFKGSLQLFVTKVLGAHS